MKKLKTSLKKFWADESGQGATEYILLLVVVVAIAMIFKNQIKDTVTNKMSELSSSIMGFTGE